MSPAKSWLWGLGVCVVAFGAALVRLFQLRFDSGELYPTYSTFRADPLGCRAFYESLERLGGLRVWRNLDPQPSFEEPRGQTLCVFGVVPRQLWVSPLEAQALDSFVRRGGRLVITFWPSTWAPEVAVRTNQTERPKLKHQRRFVVNLAEKWGVEFQYAPLPRENEPGRAFACRSATELPDSISWHSTLVFTNLAAPWKIIYRRDQHPVLIERPLGNGTMVFAADSYFVSNEALLRERHPALLAWLIGPATAVCFDETHLGVAVEPGMATLFRKYRLHGLVVAVLVFAALFVWRQATPFLPPQEEHGRAEQTVGGRSASAGFVALLRRSLAPQDLLRVCLAEWEKSFARTHRYRLERVVQAREAVASSDPVAAYERIQRLLAEHESGLETLPEMALEPLEGSASPTAQPIEERN